MLIEGTTFTASLQGRIEIKHSPDSDIFIKVGEDGSWNVLLVPAQKLKVNDSPFQVIR